MSTRIMLSIAFVFFLLLTAGFIVAQWFDRSNPWALGAVVTGIGCVGCIAGSDEIKS